MTAKKRDRFAIKPPCPKHGHGTYLGFRCDRCVNEREIYRRGFRAGLRRAAKTVEERQTPRPPKDPHAR